MVSSDFKTKKCLTNWIFEFSRSKTSKNLVLFNFSLVSLVKNHGLFDFYYVDPSFNLEKIVMGYSWNVVQRILNGVWQKILNIFLAFKVLRVWIEKKKTQVFIQA